MLIKDTISTYLRHITPVSINLQQFSTFSTIYINESMFFSNLSFFFCLEKYGANVQIKGMSVLLSNYYVNLPNIG